MAQLGISRDIVRAVAHGIALAGYDPGAEPPAEAVADGPMVPSEAADAVFDRAAKALGDPALGLTVAASVPIGSLGVLDYGLCTSATVGEAVRRIVRYYGVATQRVRLHLEVSGADARLEMHRAPGLQHSRHWMEFSCCIIARRLSDTSGQALGLTEVGLAHAAPADPARHRAAFGCPVVWDAPRDYLAFPTAALDRPLLTASRSLVDLLESRMRELGPEIAPHDPLMTRIRAEVAAMLDERATGIAPLARRLRMSQRSLQRALGERGSSYTAVLEDIRRERAVRLLADGARVAEVSTRLGFSEPSAFFRAYRRWTGSSPRAATPPSRPR